MGDQFGRYELLRKLAAGGMGEVYLARQEGAAGFEKRVVIKKILRQFSSDPKFVERFIQEGKTLVSLSHGNIVPVFDLGVVDGEYYLAMEYVDGKDLREVVRFLRERGETLPWHLVALVMGEVSRGLTFAHNRKDEDGRSLNIIHRDVSPSNIILSREGEAKILDFGIARSSRSLEQTISGFIEGKVYYMSPEQARGEHLDRRSDVFSLGVVFYEVLTGVRPFDGDNELQVLDRIKSIDPKPPWELKPEIPRSLGAVVMRCLDKDPARRHQDCSEIMDDLQKALIEERCPASSVALKEFLDARAFFDDPGQPPPAARSFDDLLNEQLSRESARSLQRATGNPHTRTLSRRETGRAYLLVLLLVGVVVVAMVLPSLLPPGLGIGITSPPQAPEVAPTLVVVERLPRRPGLDLAHAPVRRAGEAALSTPTVEPPQPTREAVQRPEAAVERLVTLVSDPAGTVHDATGRELGGTPFRARLGRGQSLSLEVRAAGRKPVPVTLGPASGEEVSVSLPRAMTGRLVFRFFPASAVVLLDGERVRGLTGNVVDLALPEGEHSLVLSHPDGTPILERHFRVSPERDTNLGTLKEEP